MVKALIGTSLKTYNIVFIRYDGDQSIDDLKKIVVNWVSSMTIKDLTKYGNVTFLGSGLSETKWQQDEPESEQPNYTHSVVVNNITDFTDLFRRSLPAVKREQFKKEADEKNAKLAKGRRRVSPRKCYYKDDGFRPEVMFLCKNINNSTIEWMVNENDKNGWQTLKTMKDQA
jgi:hypothetical protein